MEIMEHSILVPDFPEYPVQIIDWNTPDPWDIPVHSHNFDELLFFRKGGGIHSIGSKKFELLAYQVHFIPKGVNHILNREEVSSGFTLAYDRSFLEENLKLFLQALPFYQRPIRFVYSFRPSTFERIIELKSKIDVEIKNSSNYFSQALFLSYVSTLLLEISKELQEQLSSQKINPRMKETLHALEHYLIQNRSIQLLTQEKIASSLFISTQHLYEICKSYYGKSPKRLADESLITHAKDLLMSQKYNAQEVSDLIGFSEPAAFSRYFKRYTGISPSQYQKS